CGGGGVKLGIAGCVPGAVVCVTLFDATRVGPCPTPKAKPNTRIITRPAAPAIHPQLPVRSAGSYPYIGSFGSRKSDMWTSLRLSVDNLPHLSRVSHQTWASRIAALCWLHGLRVPKITNVPF